MIPTTLTIDRPPIRYPRPSYKLHPTSTHRGTGSPALNSATAARGLTSTIGSLVDSHDEALRRAPEQDQEYAPVDSLACLPPLTRTLSGSDSNNALNIASDAPVDSPEANATRSIRLFCETASDANREEEVLHLPVIVEAAESSPVAAAAAAQQIKRFLSRDYATRPHVQYNAIMLVRILSDNPGPTFTKCFDQSFVKNVKELLRGCKDHGTQQILREALDSIEVNKAHDEGAQGLIAMWRKEKGSSNRLNQPRMSRGPGGYQSGGYQQNNERVLQRNQLPPPTELASRIEESRNTAKILLQLIQQSTSEELVSNGLVREFAERCQSAQKSMQGYISCDSPAPDDDTMLTLIETNEQLSLASSRYQRAMLAARRQLGTAATGTASPEAMNDGYGAFTSPPAAGQAESLFQPAASSTPANDFSNGHSPVSPIMHHARTNSRSHDASNSNGNTYQVPSGPPPNQQFQHQREPSAASSLYGPANPPSQEVNDPFRDPEDHTTQPPLLAMPPPPPRKPITESSPTTYSYNSSNISPVKDAPQALEEPHLLSRPGMGPWHNSGATPSYMGRQSSASNGLTMHGAGGQDGYTTSAVEIGGNSDIGRNREGNGYNQGTTVHSVDPVTGERTDRSGRRLSRVDVPGTGGLRDPRV